MKRRYTGVQFSDPLITLSRVFCFMRLLTFLFSARYYGRGCGKTPGKGAVLNP